MEFTVKAITAWLRMWTHDSPGLPVLFYNNRNDGDSCPEEKQCAMHKSASTPKRRLFFPWTPHTSKITSALCFSDKYGIPCPLPPKRRPAPTSRIPSLPLCKGPLPGTSIPPCLAWMCMTPKSDIFCSMPDSSQFAPPLPRLQFGLSVQSPSGRCRSQSVRLT